MSEFIQLPPQPVRPLEEEAKKSPREILKMPEWQCFCCCDSGRVQPHLARLVIPSYNYTRDKLVLCQHRACAATYWNTIPEENLDQRFNPEVCKRLHEKEKQNWVSTRSQQYQQLQLNLENLAKSKSLRRSDRTENDDREALLRKEEAQYQLDNPEVREDEPAI